MKGPELVMCRMLRSGVQGCGQDGSCDGVGSREVEARASKSRAEWQHQTDTLRNCRRSRNCAEG